MRPATLVLLTILCGPAAAAVRTETVEYRHGETVLEGFVAWDDSTQQRRPGILVIHEWTGQGEYVQSRAKKLAALGYVAFALDMYGKGVRPASPKDAGAEAAKYKNERGLMRTRAKAGLEVLRKHPLCDPKRIAAIGYCFGGTCALELARAGEDIVGVVSFHGGLATPTPEDAKNIRAKVLVLHGADDPHVPPKEVAAFEDEMRSAGVDWQLVAYGRAVHAFTNPASGNDNSRGAAYNAAADRRSWQAMRTFFDEVFGSG